jgi:hypothetical protein
VPTIGEKRFDQHAGIPRRLMARFTGDGVLPLRRMERRRGGQVDGRSSVATQVPEQSVSSSAIHLNQLSSPAGLFSLTND